LFFRDRVLYYSKLGAKLDVYVDEMSAPGDCISQLQECDAIHLSGGNTFTFAQWLRQSNLFDALIHYAQGGRPLIGVSAGAILLTKSIASAALCGDSRPDDVVDERGLSLVQFGFWPHFSGHSGAPTTEDRLQDTYGTLYACPNGCAVLVNEMQIESFGQVEVLSCDV
jgi:dipeptidase E